MRFIVANYGTRHLGMLLVHLESVAATHPRARQSVYWQDIPEHFIAALQAAFPGVDWVRTEFDFAHDPIQRISSKVFCWSRAVGENAGENALVLCDSDTLVRRDLSPFFAQGDADVIFTTKPESAPLNSGVMLARGGPAATEFFRAWRDATIAILRTPAECAKANDSKHPYGGADQMSLYQLLDYTREREIFTFRGTAEHGAAPMEVRLRAEPCARLNETNSRPLTDEIHIVHYKAGWQSILLDGRPFSRFRPRTESWEMLGLFLDTLDAGLKRVHAATGENFTARDFRIHRPWYYREGRFRFWAYAAWRVRAACRRGWLAATGRLQPGM
jgi:hypothetical protein